MALKQTPWYLDYKKWFEIILSASWISGLSFFIFNNFITTTGEFGIEKHPAQYPILKAHGACAFIIMVTYGYYLGAHVRKNWKVSPKPISGLTLFSIPILLIISGWILYYIASDNLRQNIGYAHFSLGLILPIILVIHIRDVTSKKGKAKYKYKRRAAI